MRFLDVPHRIRCSVHFSPLTCCPQFVSVAQQSLCVVSVRSTPLQLRCVSHVTDRTATAVLAQGSSLSVIKKHHGSGAWFVDQECW